MLSLRLLSREAIALVACLVLVACGSTSTGNSSQNGKPAGADKTNITDWTDPRPTSWSTKYPLFAPVKIGDGSLKRVQDSKRLLICAELKDPPISSIDPKTGDVVGWEVDVANEMAKGLGIAAVAYVDIPFASLIPALQSNKCDILMDGISIKSSRAQAPGIKYTTPYLPGGYDLLYVRTDSSVTKLADLKGKSVATESSTVDDASLRLYIDQMGGGITIHDYAGQPECVIAVANRTDDACFLEPNNALIAQYTQVKMLTTQYIYLPPAGEAKLNPYCYACGGIITKSEDGDLNLALSLELDKLRVSGQITAALDKFNEGFYDPPTDPSYTFANPNA